MWKASDLLIHFRKNEPQTIFIDRSKDQKSVGKNQGEIFAAWQWKWTESLLQTIRNCLYFNVIQNLIQQWFKIRHLFLTVIIFSPRISSVLCVYETSLLATKLEEERKGNTCQEKTSPERHRLHMFVPFFSGGTPQVLACGELGFLGQQAQPERKLKHSSSNFISIKIFCCILNIHNTKYDIYPS